MLKTGDIVELNFCERKYQKLFVWDEPGPNFFALKQFTYAADDGCFGVVISIYKISGSDLQAYHDDEAYVLALWPGPIVGWIENMFVKKVR